MMTDKEKLSDLRNSVEHAWIHNMNASWGFPGSTLRIRANVYKEVLDWIDDLIKDRDDGMLTELSEKEALECNDWKEAGKKEFYNNNICTSHSTMETFMRGFRCGQYWAKQTKTNNGNRRNNRRRNCKRG